DPQAALHAICVARVAEEDRAFRADIVGASRHFVRDLMAAIAGAAVEAPLDRTIATVEAPGLREEGVDGLTRDDARAAERSTIQQHSPNTRQPAGGDAQTSLRGKERAVFTQIRATEVTRFA